MDETIGIYGGDDIGSAPSPTGRIRNARYNKIIEAIGGAGYHVTDTPSLSKSADRRPRSRKTCTHQLRYRSDGGA